MKKMTLLLLSLAALLAASCAGKPTECSLQAMTYNIRYDNPADSLNNWQYRKDHAAQMIRYYAPDILGMQEVLVNQRNDLMERLPQYTALGIGRIDGKEEGEFCSLLFKTDRFDLLRQGTFGMSEHPDSIGLRGWDAACERITTWAVLRDRRSGKELAVFNTHFDHMGEVARRESAHLILSKMKELAPGLPTLLMGDFNGAPDSEPITIVAQGGMQGCHTAAEVKWGPAWSFHDFGRIAPAERELIDFIFASPQMQVKRYRVIADTTDSGYLSDHTPVMAEVAF